MRVEVRLFEQKFSVWLNEHQPSESNYPNVNSNYRNEKSQVISNIRVTHLTSFLFMFEA